MKRSAQWTIVVLVVAAAVFLFWPQDEEKKIRAFLDRAVEMTHVKEQLLPLECRARAITLAEVVSPTFEFDYRFEGERYQRTLTVKEAVNLLTLACARVVRAEGAMTSVKIRTTTKQHAEVELFFVAQWRESGESEDFTAGEQLTLQLEKEEGSWRIQSVQNHPRNID